MELLLLRHAKSSWKDPSLLDFDRPLNKRGVQTAIFMGRWMREQEIMPDLVICSSAARAVQTCALWVQASEYPGEVIYDDDLYHGTPRAMCSVLAAHAGKTKRPMMIGHNPGMQDWIEQQGEEGRFPTGALALLGLQKDQWLRVGPKDFEVFEVWKPKRLGFTKSDASNLTNR